MERLGFIKTATNAQIDAHEKKTMSEQAIQRELDKTLTRDDDLAAHIRTKFTQFRNVRESRNITNRLLASLRAFNGEYDAAKLREINSLGGSDVFARVTAVKCRGATAMLRDVYLGAERPWAVEPTPVPEVPGEIMADIMALVQSEQQDAVANGTPIQEIQVQNRVAQLTTLARQTALKKAKDAAVQQGNKIEDILDEGGFYDALAEFLHDITVFPYAVIKGPVVEMSTELGWDGPNAVLKTIPRMFWQRVSPFDLYWQSSARKFKDAEVIEHQRVTAPELDSLRGLPGYNDAAITDILNRYGENGYTTWINYADDERAILEEREDPAINDSGMIDMLTYYGKVQGKILKEWDFPAITDESKHYSVIANIIDNRVIKVIINPNPRAAHPYYMSSFEKIPGAIIGHGIPELIGDIQSVMNATLRSLVNNLSIASGPQVVIDLDQLSEATNPSDMYPWKRWFTEQDPLKQSMSNKPIDFYQPQSNSQDLLYVYQQMSQIADEISAIPKYATGNERVGGAGRTASGLSMLMGAASKVLQSVASNIDNDVIKQNLQQLHELLMLTDVDHSYNGDAQIVVRGVNFAVQKETERLRSLEFLNITNNPTDQGIIGIPGRAAALRTVANGLGMDDTKIIPDDETLQAMQQQQQIPPEAMGGQQAQNPNPGNGAVEAPIRNITPGG